MSEKTRQKKEGEDKNKNNRRMRAVNRDLDDKTPGRKTGRSGNVKRAHHIDSVSTGYDDNGNQSG